MRQYSNKEILFFHPKRSQYRCTIRLPETNENDDRILKRKKAEKNNQRQYGLALVFVC